MKDDRINPEANKEYWDKAKGAYLDKMVFRVIPENPVRFPGAQSGQHHQRWIFPTPADIEMARKDPKLQIISQPGMNIGYLGFNHKERSSGRASSCAWPMAHAINRKAIVDKIYQGMGEVAKNGIPPTMGDTTRRFPDMRMTSLAKSIWPGGLSRWKGASERSPSGRCPWPGPTIRKG